MTTVDGLRTRLMSAFAPPTTLTVSEFADAEIVLPSSEPVPGRWSTDFAPYERGILNAFHEDGVQTVVVMGSSQWGKTACAVVMVAYHIAHDPCPILVVTSTVDPMAKVFAQSKLEPIINASPVLAEAVAKKRSKDQSNTTLTKSFRGGTLSVVGANSASSLASRSVRFLVLDEIDRYPPELPGEGNTVSVALKRTTAFGRRKRRLILSSPTVQGGPIDSWFNRGDQRRYHVPCTRCRAKSIYRWQQVRWQGDDVTTARIHCPSCDHGLDDVERVAVLKDGVWIPDAPDRRERDLVSFHIWEAYSPLVSLRETVGAFMAARIDQKRGDRSTMHVWSNTALGEPIEPDQGDGVEPEPLLMRREAVDPDAEVPGGACCLTAGVDVQDDRLEVLVVAWGPGEESWLVDRATLPGDTSQPDPWAALDALLDHPYRHPSGHRLRIHATCIDSAGHRTTIVYDYVEPRSARRVFAIIGRDGQRPIVSSPSPRKWGRNERQVPLYTIGVDAAKALIVSRLALAERGPGFIHLPHHDWCDEELVRQLTSERLVTKWTKGVPVQVWKKVRARNEMLDCLVYATAALRLLNPKLSAMLQALRPIVLDDAAAARTRAATTTAQDTQTQTRRIARSRYLGGG